MRRVPQLVFKLDRSLKKQADVLAAINEAVAEREADTAPQSNRDDDTIEEGES